MPKFEYTKEHIKSSKLALLIGSLTAAVADVFVVVLLMIAGLWGYIALPIVLAVADIAFFVIALFTNFRFRYSLGYTIGYLAVFIGCVLGHLFIIYGGKETAMTAIALIIWVAVHVLNFLVTVFGAKGAVTRKKGHHFVTALIVLLFVGATSLYVAFGATMGYFGQGSTTARPILYVYDEQTKTYTATGVLSGNGTTATIPAEFDGKPVGAIDAALFNATRLNTLNIETESDIEIKNLDKLEAVSVAEIYAPRETLTTLQRELYTAYRDMDTKNDLLLTLAANTAPSDLTKDEVYITFSYTDRAMACIGETYLPSWIGKKGDVFKLAELAKEIGYTQDTAVTDEALLHKLYTNNTYGGGYILLPIMLDATTPLDGATVQKSHKNVTVDFEKIYRVKVEEDNDTRHDFSDNFKMDITVDGEQVAYRYVTPSTVATLIPSVTERPGFTLAWNYKYANNTVSTEAMTESELLAVLDNGNLRDFTIKPEWTMNTPVINSLTSSKNSNAFTYGDNVNLTTSATAPADGTFLTYTYIFGGESVQSETNNVLNISPIKMTEAGTYKVIVTASSNDVTSLTSVSEQTIDLTVDKKAISMSWSAIGEAGSENTHVYNKEDHAIAVTFNESDFVFEDDFTSLAFNYTYNGSTYTSGVNARAAGNYEVTVALLGDNADKYTLSNPTKEYVIERKSVNVVWTNTTLTYNALEQAPTATAKPEDVCEGDTVTVTVAGAKTDTNLKANEQSYKATASLVDTQDQNANYRLTTETTSQIFTIDPREITVKWTGENASDTDFEYIYDGKGHCPVAVFTGVLFNQNLELVYKIDSSEDSTKTNANVNEEFYTAKVTIGNENYKVANPGIVLTQTFKITPKKLTIDWRGENNSTGDFSWVYDSKEHRPVALISSLVGEDLANESYSLAKTEAGEHTVELTIGNTNYYIQESDKTHAFVVEKRPLSIYNVVQSFVYNATARHPSFDIENLVDGTDAGFVFMDGSNAFDKKTNVGSYPCKLVVTNPNYAFEEYSMTLQITKAPLTIQWNDQLIYNSKSQTPSYEVFGWCSQQDKESGTAVRFTMEGAQSEAGLDYTATLSYESLNYSIADSYLSTSFDILPKEILIDWGETTFTYNGQAQAPTPTVVNGELFLGDSVTFKVDGAKTNTTAYEGKDVFTATATSENPNYKVRNDKTEFRINPYTVNFGSVVWYGENQDRNDFTWIYDGMEKHPTAEVINTFNDDTVVLQYTKGEKNANTTDNPQYSVIISSSNKNYTIAQGTDVNTKYYTITPKELTVSWTDGRLEPTFSWVYDASSHAPTPTFSGVVGNEDLKLVYPQAQTVVSSTPYTATVVIGNTNYYVSNLSTLSQQFTITARPLTFTWINSDYTFDGNSKFPSYSITGYAPGENENTLRFTQSIDGQDVKVTPIINAGTYSASYTINNSNYAFDSTTNQNGTMTINKRVISAQFVKNSLVYNGFEQTPDITWNNTIAGFDPVSNTAPNTKPINANTYTLTITLTGSNYCFNGNAPTATLEFEITKKPLTPNWSNTNLTYSGDAQAPTATATDVFGKVFSLNISGQQTSANTSNSNYTATAALPSDYTANYELSNNTQSYKILPKEISVSWLGDAESQTDFDYIFNGAQQIPTASAHGVKDETIDLMVTGGQTTVGSYTAKASTDNTNYTLTNTQRSFKISPKEISVSWLGENSSTTDFEYIYDGREHYPTASAQGVNGALTLTISGKQTNAGSWTATASLNNNNYTLTGTTQSFTIVPREVSVVWGSTTTFVYNGKPQAPTANATGVDNISIVLVISGNQTNVGDWTASVSTQNSNYTLTNTTKVFRITPMSVPVVWTDTNTLIYNGQAQKPTAKVTGANGEQVQIVVDGAQTNAKTGYTATASTNDQNYTLTNASTTFSIKPMTVEVVWSDTNLTYNGQTQKPTATAIGAHSESVSITVSVDGEAKDVGSYTATASTTDTNYALTNVTKTFTISSLSVRVVWTNTNTLIYNGQAQKPTATATGANGEQVQIVVDGAQTNAKTGYTATASTNDQNYTLTNASTTFSIAKKKITVTWKGENGSTNDFTYTYKQGTTYKPTATYSGVSITVTVDRTSMNRGTYTATATFANSADADNYEITNPEQQFTIE